MRQQSWLGSSGRRAARAAPPPCRRPRRQSSTVNKTSIPHTATTTSRSRSRDGTSSSTSSTNDASREGGDRGPVGSGRRLDRGAAAAAAAAAAARTGDAAVVGLDLDVDLEPGAAQLLDHGRDPERQVDALRHAVLRAMPERSGNRGRGEERAAGKGARGAGRGPSARARIGSTRWRAACGVRSCVRLQALRPCRERMRAGYECGARRGVSIWTR